MSENFEDDDYDYEESPIPADPKLQMILFAGAMYVEESNILQLIQENISDISNFKDPQQIKNSAELTEYLISGFCSLNMNMDDLDPFEAQQLLDEAWDIRTKQELYDQLDLLLSGFTQKIYAELIENTKNMIPTLDDFKVLTAHLDFYQQYSEEEYLELVDRVLENKKVWSKNGVKGWDYARYVHLIRIAFLAEIFEEEEACLHLLKLEKYISVEFKDWSSFGKSFLNGRSLWTSEVEPFDKIIQGLIVNPISPWNYFGFFKFAPPQLN